MEKEGGNGERMKKCRESISLHFLIFSPFPHSLSISSQPGCKAAAWEFSSTEIFLLRRAIKKGKQPVFSSLGNTNHVMTRKRNRQEAISIFSECVFCTSSSCRYDALPLRQRNTSTQYCQCPILIYCLHHYHHPFSSFSFWLLFLKMLEVQNDWLYGSLRRVRLE